MVGNKLNRKERRDLGECGQYKHRDLVQSDISESSIINKLRYLVELQFFLITIPKSFLQFLRDVVWLEKIGRAHV